MYTVFSLTANLHLDNPLIDDFSICLIRPFSLLVTISNVDPVITR